MLSSCFSLPAVPAFNLTSATTLTNMLENTPSLAAAPLANVKETFSVASCSLSREALVELFNGLASVSGKTITITGNHGVADLTADDRAIATGKGWTVTE